MILQNAWQGKATASRGKRRSSARLLIGQPAQLRFITGLQQAAIVEDLSSGGACVRTHLRLRIGDHIGVRMNLGAGYDFQLRARIVYSTPVLHGMHQRYGLRFVSMQQEDEQRLLECLRIQQTGQRCGLRSLRTVS